jgi:DnaK suppressor protein
MPAKRSRKPAPSRRRTSRSRARNAERAGTPSSNGSRSRGPFGASRGVAGRVEEFTQLLLEERKRLRQELSEMEEHQLKTEEKPADAANEDDLVDVATETFEREKELALESSIQGILEMVEEALQRVQSGTYGICSGCDKPIDGNRLRAIPYARLCIKCKEREERQRAVAR